MIENESEKKIREGGSFNHIQGIHKIVNHPIRKLEPHYQKTIYQQTI